MEKDEPILPGDVVMAAEQYRSTFLAITLSAPLILDPSKPIVAWNRRYTGIREPREVPLTLGGRGNSELTLSLESVIDDVLQHDHKELTQDLLAMGMVLSAMKIGELIDRGNYRDKTSPLLEFARHYRNACAHNRRWSFRPHEPANPAALRDLVLHHDLNGTIAPYATVTPEDHLYFLDDISSHFGSIALQNAYNELLPTSRGRDLQELESLLNEALQRQGMPEDRHSLKPGVLLALQRGYSSKPYASSRTYD